MSMATLQAVERSVLDVAYAHAARTSESGLASHAHALRLADASGPQAARDLADAVHLLCSLYGRHPGWSSLHLTIAPMARRAPGSLPPPPASSASGSISSA
jgi:hypothetical protein